jgi:hypothetical protein
VVVFLSLWGPLYGLIGGLSAGLIGGIDAVFKHYILRIYFWRCGYMPRDYVRFLDYAAERIFLRKVGGGYIFIHRLIMEYFAELDDKSLADDYTD